MNLSLMTTSRSDREKRNGTSVTPVYRGRMLIISDSGK